MAYTVNESIIKQAQKEYNDAKAKGDTVGMNNAHAKAEAERAKAGYLGGADGSQRIATNTSTSTSNSKKTPTTIWDSNGSATVGYIQDGKTYYNDGSRIKEGSTVIDSSGVEWRMENGQGVRTGQNYGVGTASGGAKYTISDIARDNGAFDAYYEKQLQTLQEQARQQAEAQAEAQKAQIEANKQIINQNYANSARQAYINSMQQQKALPEYLASTGQSGGASESAQLQLQTNYQNNLSDLEMAKNNALANENLAYNDVSTNLASQLAGINSDYSERLLNYYQQARAEALAEKESQAKLEASRLAEEKEDYLNTIGQYYDDYQAEIERLKRAGVADSDYRIQYLKAARAQKLFDLQNN